MHKNSKTVGVLVALMIVALFVSAFAYDSSNSMTIVESGSMRRPHTSHPAARPVVQVDSVEAQYPLWWVLCVCKTGCQTAPGHKPSAPVTVVDVPVEPVVLPEPEPEPYIPPTPNDNCPGNGYCHQEPGPHPASDATPEPTQPGQPEDAGRNKGSIGSTLLGMAVVWHEHSLANPSARAIAQKEASGSKAGKQHAKKHKKEKSLFKDPEDISRIMLLMRMIKQ